jgi:hypothetical protein
LLDTGIVAGCGVDFFFFASAGSAATNPTATNAAIVNTNFFMI